MELAAVPPGAVTEITPVVAPFGTTAVIWVFEFTTKMEAGVPLKVTAVAPARLAPVIVTFVPTGPLVGAKEVIDTGGMTAAGMAMLTMPSGRTGVPVFTMGEENGVKGCSTTKIVKCVTEAVSVVPSALNTAWNPVPSYFCVSGL